MRTLTRSIAALSSMACLAAMAACAPRPEPFARISGLLLDADLGEVSGMAASRTHAGVLWMVNDGGNAPELYAVSRRGRRLATYRIDGVVNTDWEDLAAFELDGRRYLLVADTGDNGGLRKTLQLHAIAEPAAIADAMLKPAWSIVFRWPDGARDCEAVAVDAAARQVLLVSKKRQPPELFALPLAPRNGGLQTARRLGRLAAVPQAGADEVRRDPARARLRGQVTAADIAPDGHSLAVMTYRDVLVYPRVPDQPWAAAVARPPRVHPLPWLHQPEALAWAASGGSLYATGEIIPTPIYLLTP